MLKPSDLPYTETVEDGMSIRTFPEGLTQYDLPWHRDREDRWVTALYETDWKIQRDNELPVLLWGQSVFIPMGEWHRVIPGKGEMVCVVRKIV
jgi:hypothetical protein